MSRQNQVPGGGGRHLQNICNTLLKFNFNAFPSGGITRNSLGRVHSKLKFSKSIVVSKKSCLKMVRMKVENTQLEFELTRNRRDLRILAVI